MYYVYIYVYIYRERERDYNIVYHRTVSDAPVPEYCFDDSIYDTLATFMRLYRKMVSMTGAPGAQEPNSQERVSECPSERDRWGQH